MLAKLALEACKRDAWYCAEDLEARFPKDPAWQIVAEAHREAALAYDKALDHPLFTEEQEDEC